MFLCFALVFNTAWAFSPYSNRELDQLEKEFVEQINQSSLVIRDPLAELYINHLSKRLAEHGDIKTPDFFIVKSGEINAFAGPGGHIGINTALILASDNESELAAVMSHEMAHVRLHHLYRMLEHQKQMQIPKLASMLASIALGIINPMAGTGAMMATLGGFAQDDINFIRSNEKEADRIGIDILYKSGLDPQGMANFFGKMQQNSRYYYTANVPAILRTHPIDEERISEAENRCAQLKLHPVTSSLDYPLFKELIRATVSQDDKKLLEYYQQCLNHHPEDTTCLYGMGLTLFNLNRYAAAEEKLMKLAQAEPNNLFYLLPLARIQSSSGHFDTSIKTLNVFYEKYPDNYAILIALAESEASANHPQQAISFLLKASRLYPKNVSVCESLARAYANNKQQGFAYFTEAQCAILQGQNHEAKRLLKLALTLTKQDKYLKARIEAKLDEIM